MKTASSYVWKQKQRNNRRVFKVSASDNENFLKFLEYLALFNPLMHEYLHKIHDNETKVQYLSKDVQNEMIKLLANVVQNEIISLVHAAKYYSTILDSTLDVSHTEQMTVIVRSVAIAETTSEIREHFIGFIPLSEKNGANLTEATVEKLKELELRIDDLRSQGYDNGNGFGSIPVDTRGVAGELNIQPTFETETLPSRLRKKKKQFDYETDDEPLVSPQEHFKVNFYFALSILHFIFWMNDSTLNTATTKSLMEDCMNLKHFLSNNEARDIEGHKLCNEVQAIVRRVPKNAHPEDVLNFIISNYLKDCASNLSGAFRILLTLHVFVASGKRSFSKLKYIKTYIRSTAMQERLQGLATLSVE
ncbi:hypothetical protein QYM36_016838 [Artemia franciscana]|uniref:DUF4371 domain-containing protein n=1 Tax=Artemia franciscana TaxID=6661 RepID=A0AA88KW86_ARTSF|nr:hypothetical protein QYM36_016838 [Artemia franciscana]